MVTRAQILAEIRRTARARPDGTLKPLGRRQFLTETGLRESDWAGRYWSRWSDAVREAGLTPNARNERTSKAVMLGKIAELTRELGKFPGQWDMRLRRQSDQSFPDVRVLARRIGLKAQQAAALLAYCRATPEFADVIPLVESLAPTAPTDEDVQSDGEGFGFVYLMKSGRNYKIGRSNSVGRREYEVALQLPERVHRVHEIRTDDPAGIEAYWHNRFREKRGNGEWFKLDAEDVAAFKRRRKFM
jgi:hypothetical protein